VIDIAPEGESRAPLQPSPLAPPVAAQALAFCEVQLSETEVPTTSLEALAVSAAVGLGTAGSLGLTGV